MAKKNDSLLFKFAIILVTFTIIILLIGSVNDYYNQTNSYKEQAEQRIQDIAESLEKILSADGKNFLTYQKYFLQNHEKILIRRDFSEYQADKIYFEKLFAEKYPGKVFNVDVNFEDMPEDLKIAFTKYYHEYWLLTFEKMRDAFGIKYCYYVVPAEEKLHMLYVIDSVRELKESDGVEYIRLCDNIFQSLEEHQKMWEAWETREKPTGYDYCDNEYGRTYAYFMPLNLDGKTVGVIGTEIEIEKVSAEILRLTLFQSFSMMIILFICIAILIWYLNKKYISKISHLQFSVHEYAQNKDPAIVRDIEKDISGKDEISALSMQFAAMILELENYMKSLIKITGELSDTKEKVQKMHELAHKDALTGVNNKTSYDKAIRGLDWKIEDGSAEFAIVMIDLNFLKRINDTYGHEQGNFAIKKLCHIVEEIFANSQIFRIGGDEFVVISEGKDFFRIDSLIEEFNNRLEEIEKNNTLEPLEKTSAAVGVAIFDKFIDSSATNVFKRADKAMYLRKKEMKAVRLN